MLILTRHKDETIVIGDPANPTARITVVEIRGDKVRLGIDAEKVVPVHRAEIAEEIVRDRQEGDSNG